MGLLDSLIGAATEAAMGAQRGADASPAGGAGGLNPQLLITLVSSLLNNAGGLQGLLAKLQAQKGNQQIDVVILDDGPMYQAIALGFCAPIQGLPADDIYGTARYKDDKGAESQLIGRVKAGGSGTWGDVAMPPQAHVSDADTAALIKWILSGSPEN